MLRRLYRSKWMAIGWTALIFVLLVWPTHRLGGQGLLGIPHTDKLVHVFLFGVFVIVWYNFFQDAFPERISHRMILWLIILSSLYGIAMEFVQDAFTKRSFEAADMLADLTGATLAGLWLRIKKGPYGNRGRNQN